MITANAVGGALRVGAPGQWFLLPDAVRADVEAVTGARVIGADHLGGCGSPGAVRLRFASGARRLLKTIPLDHVLFPRYRAEAEHTRALLSAGLPVPRLRVAWQAGGWWLMAFDDVSGARHPDLSPGSPDIRRALGLLDRLFATPTATLRPRARGFVPAVGEALCRWRQLAERGADLEPWAARNLDRLVATERFWIHYGDGSTLLHADLGTDTMLLADRQGGDVALDWAYLHRGAAWIDPALFVPHLILAGHTPAQAEALMDGSAAAWADAPAEAITFFAIALTGYWEHSCRLPFLPQAPDLRLYQSRMAGIGRAWIRHRTDWT
ncbi:hypothetical protein [Streptacidiphilus melanogenes]|uniref:hypothetical protein n=1 Tax=Streptacidiphilus melanogenes TaxID=411235 RepID=UPI000694E6D3|nr:hypothetical protein [Streptacidiphilus melanogenes]